MLQSIFVYSLLFGSMLLCAQYASKKSSCVSISSGIVKERSFWHIEIIFPLILFAVVFGMRYDVGVDHLNYLEGYINRDYIGKQEYLFNLLSDIGWKFNLHFVVYFGIIAFIQVFFFFYAFKDERFLFPLLTFFIFTNGDILSWMNIIRHSLAICIWVFSIRYIEKKGFWTYSFWCVIAFLFHRSAIVLIIFYPILRNGRDYLRSVPFQLILMLSAFVFRALFAGMIMRFEPIIDAYINVIGGGLYQSYDVDGLMDSFREPEGTGLAYLFKILLNLVIIIFSKKIKTFYNSKRFNIIYFFFFLGLITTYMFPVGAIAITRPFRYFYIFQTIMYAYFLYYLYKTKLKNTLQGSLNALMYYGLIIVFLGIFYMSQITSNEYASLWYQFFFDHSIRGYG